MIHAVLGTKENPNSANLIAYIAEKSPASKSGLKNGDILLKINKENIGDWRKDVNKILSKANSVFWVESEKEEHTLTVMRGGETLEFKVKLENFLDKK